MGKLPDNLLKKIKNNIDKIGDDLREFGAVEDGNYLKNTDKSLKMGHIFSWQTSFFVGMALWAYVDTQDKYYLEWCEKFYDEYYAKVYETPADTMHDLGFLYSPYAVMLWNITGDNKYKNLALGAADLLAKRFVPCGGYIQAWGRIDGVVPEYVDAELSEDHFFTESKGLAIIDCMMNLPLLFWASAQSGHPFYERIARCHADMTAKYFVRSDYSVNHAFRFSSDGKPIGDINYCGYSNGSFWARGCAWAIYGFAIAYRYTSDLRYLDLSVKLLEKFMSECGKDIPKWDFAIKENCDDLCDTAAAAVVLCAIVELKRLKKLQNFSVYEQVLRDNLKKYINSDVNVMGILGKQNGKNTYAAFGDYFLIESYMKEMSDIIVW